MTGGRGFYLLFPVFLTALILAAGCGKKAPPKLLSKPPPEAFLIEKDARAIQTAGSETDEKGVL